MKNFSKIILVLIILAGISFSVSNFLSVELEANPDMGAWEFFEETNTWKCLGDGNECSKKTVDIVSLQ